MAKIIKNAFQTSIINYIGVVIGFISVLFIQTEVLSEDEIGIVKLILDKALLVLPFFIFGIHSVASRFFFHFENDKKSYSRFMTYLLFTPLLIFLVGVSILLAFKVQTLVSNFFYIATLLLFYIYISIFESYLSTKQKIIIPSFLRYVLFRILYIIGLGLLYFNFINFNQLLFYYLGMYAVHFLILLIYFIKNLSYSIRFNLQLIKNPVFKEILTYSSFLILGAGSGILVSKLDTIMIEGITNNKGFVGIYTIAFAMASIIEVPRRPLIKLFTPILSQKLKENRIPEVAKIYKKSAINLLIVGSIIFTLIWLNIDFIFSLIPNRDIYIGGKSIVFFLGLAKLFDMAVGVNYEILQSSKYYKWNIFLMPFLAIISISLNYYFISEDGYIGAAIATAISILIFNFIRTSLVYIKLQLNPFDKKYLITLLLTVLPFIINHYLIIENLYINLLASSLSVFIFFIIPLYFFKVSEEYNKIVNLSLSRFIGLIKFDKK